MELMQERKMMLDKLEIGQSARITAVGGEGALRQHFLDMGLIPGAEVTLVKFAPMGDPMELRIHGYELTLRLADAAKIDITPVRAAPSPPTAVIRADWPVSNCASVCMLSCTPIHEYPFFALALRLAIVTLEFSVIPPRRQAAPAKSSQKEEALGLLFIMLHVSRGECGADACSGSPSS